MRNLAVCCLVFAVPISVLQAQPDVTSGQRAYELCAGCHGFEGQGNQLVNAPRLAGVESWYLERQIMNFADGIRGHVDGDENGRRMALMASAIDSERKLMDLLAYINILPAEQPPLATVTGDVERGQTAYSLCASCHGPRARGNAAIASPGLVMLDDWYLIEQLRQYAEGIRGVHADDSYGQQMRAISSTFADPSIRQNIAAYINSLAR